MIFRTMVVLLLDSYILFITRTNFKKGIHFIDGGGVTPTNVMTLYNALYPHKENVDQQHPSHVE